MLEEKTKQEQQRLTPSIGEGVHNVQSRYEYVIVCGCFAASALCIWGCFIIGKLDHQINEEIRDKELRVIGANGDQLGIMSSADALALAEEKELDLVKIAPNAVPPVCKIMDYGKFRFEQLKKEKEAKKNQRVVEVKEIRMSPSIDTNDLNTKVKNAMKFLKDGNRVKVTVRFRGREMAHTSLGEVLLKQFGESCAEVATVEKGAKLEGRNMSMFLSPKNSK
jgi:translation initiation factor IF-3